MFCGNVGIQSFYQPNGFAYGHEDLNDRQMLHIGRKKGRKKEKKEEMKNTELKMKISTNHLVILCVTV